ncbi:ArsR/SmtB family transcription factor [Rhizorhapis sp. SPR117]|uniref:ArsR/SmtB family transcription factor n=1 Tax=Rhizorhapis sp. SPR117 TaxID=2912611 RepID=UPI001F02633A|nr:metalloregulator ArsR/SmtB family transcription factor [Rhizorhapis sp. SPR117]
MNAPVDLTELNLQAKSVARKLKLLGNPDRLVMLCKLGMEEQSVTDLVRLTGLAQSSVSQHLAVLRTEEVVAWRKEAQTIYYSLADEQVRAIIEALCAICRPDVVEKEA